MRKMVRTYAGHHRIRQAAEDAILGADVPERDREGEADAIFEDVRNRMRFTSDPRGYEMITAPTYLLDRGLGDCDDFTVLLGSMLESVGIKTRIKIVRSPGGGGPYRHVYLEALVGAGGWKPYDASNATELAGWEPMHGDFDTREIGLSGYPSHGEQFGDADAFDGDQRSMVLYDDDNEDDGLGFVGALLGVVGSLVGSQLDKKNQEDALDDQKEAEKESAKLLAKQLKQQEKAANKQRKKEARIAAKAAAASSSGGGGGGVPSWVWPAAAAGAGVLVLTVVMKRRR